ncbi:MAG: hypothetical protein ACXVDD_18545 [Polyangia bacterium]
MIPPARDTDRDPSATPWTPVVVVLLVTVGVAVWMFSFRIPVSRSIVRPPSHLVTTLSADVRERLRPRMRRHAAVMSELTNAVDDLNDTRIARAATAVLDDPQVARPLSAEAAALETELPPLFHDFEEALRGKTEALLAAAQTHDGERIAMAHAELAWTCAQCHAAFAGP